MCEHLPGKEGKFVTVPVISSNSHKYHSKDYYCDNNLHNPPHSFHTSTTHHTPSTPPQPTTLTSTTYPLPHRLCTPLLFTTLLHCSPTRLQPTPRTSPLWRRTRYTISRTIRQISTTATIPPTTPPAIAAELSGGRGERARREQGEREEEEREEEEKEEEEREEEEKEEREEG